jgi:hypothetical protein
METEPDLADDKDIRIGSIALRERLLSFAQLREALSLQAREAIDRKMPRQLGLIMLSKGFITEEQLGRLLLKQSELRKLA